MRSKLLILLVLACVVIAFNCTPEQSKSIFTRENIPSTIITINTGKDTLVKTPRGAFLKIPAGSIANKSGTEAKLEIKEVYTMLDIIKAGLYTQSNGEPLSSGGMIYINAVAGQELTITKKIEIAIPADYANAKMKLYNGEEKNDGSINWNNPSPLPENKQAELYEEGGRIFQQNCASCHGIGRTLAAPDLAHFGKRFPFLEEGDSRYYYHLMQNIDTSVNMDFEHFTYSHAYDIYKCNLMANGNKTYGTQFFDLTTDAYMSIFKYIQNESDRNNLPMPVQTPLKSCADSCETYQVKLKKLMQIKEETEAQRNKYISENGNMTTVANNNPGNTNMGNVNFSDFDKLVRPENFIATYYQFSIESFGWFNIDVLLKDVDGVKESNLFVRIRGEWRERVDLYLIIPGEKVFVKGGRTEAEEDQYAFMYKDGKINLPQGAKAYILAMSEQSQKMAFALKEFTTSTQQQFDISLAEVTKSEFESTLSIFKKYDLQVGVASSKNAYDIKLTDGKIESVNKELKTVESEKPVNCDCDCGAPQQSPQAMPAIESIK